MPILHWLNDEEARKTSSRVPYRLLEADMTLSYGDPTTENMLIQGDNLEALKALLPYYAGQVKCIFIDPPYNTKSAFEHYNDNIEHAQWLAMIYPRIELLQNLLAEDGSIWVTIDDNEAHYLKVVMDEVFGRGNFAANVVWRSSDASNNDAKSFSLDHNQVLVYGKKAEWRAKPLSRTEESNLHYKNPDNDPKGSWFSGNLSSPKPRPNLKYTVVSPTGYEIQPPNNGWRWKRETLFEMIDTGEVTFSKDGTRLIKKTYLADQSGLAPSTLWGDIDETGHNRQAKYELKKLFPETATSDLFATPKPERLIKRILEIATNTGDLVLDSFLGSGTTAAVAHKMGRRYIGIEMGEHSVTHCVPRLKKVIEGEQGGISKEINWQGGGGFHFYRLGETIFNEEGQINPAVKFRPLAAHVWFTETHTPLDLTLSFGHPSPKRRGESSPLLGIHNSTAYYLLYNGILGDKTKDGGNVLTGKVLASLPPHQGPKVIYGELTTFGSQRLTRENIVFKQVPYDIKAR